MKKILKFCLIAFLVLVVYNMFFGSEDDETTSNIKPTAAPKKEAQTTEKPKVESATKTEDELAYEEAINKMKEEAEAQLAQLYDSYEFIEVYNKVILRYRVHSETDLGKYTSRVSIYTGLYKGYYEYAWDFGLSDYTEEKMYTTIQRDIAGTWIYKDSEKDYEITIYEDYTTNDYQVKIPVEYSLKGYNGKNLASSEKELWSQKELFAKFDAALTDESELERLRTMRITSEDESIVFYVHVVAIGDTPAGIMLDDGTWLKRK